MPRKSRRHEIIDAIVAKLSIITTANKFNTDAGSAVYWATPKITADEAAAVIFWPQPESTNIEQYRNGLINLPFTIELIQEIFDETTLNRNDMAEYALSDIKQCIQGAETRIEFNNGNYDPADITGLDAITLEGVTSGATSVFSRSVVTSGSFAGGDAVGTFYCYEQENPFQDLEALNITGGPSSIANVTGTSQHSAIETTTGNLAENLRYIEGGVPSIPENSDKRITVIGSFEAWYDLKNGNPYDA